MSNPDSNPNQPRLLSFTLDGWSVLGGRVTVSLHDGVAVLVGRNGAGKSAILEGFQANSSCAIGKFNPVSQNDVDNVPKILEIEILTSTKRRLKYNYEYVTISPSDKDDELDYSTVDDSEENLFSWNDCCQYLDGQKEGSWMLELLDYREEGAYKADKRDGEWKHIYTDNGKVRFAGKFIDGTPDGMQVFYYPNGKERQMGKYIGGLKEGEWKFFDESGFLFLTILFKNDIEIRFDGVKVIPETITSEERIK